MASEDNTRKRIKALMMGQKLAVLSTHNRGQPYASLVAFTCSEDLKALYFVTARSTRKFANLSENARVALLVSNSTNKESDFHEAAAATILGSAAEITGEKKQTALAHYLDKHPYLEDFAKSPTCALVRVKTHSYILVKNFQDVMELHMS